MALKFFTIYKLVYINAQIDTNNYDSGWQLDMLLDFRFQASSSLIMIDFFIIKILPKINLCDLLTKY